MVILISDCNDIPLIEEYPNATYVALQQSIIQLNKKYKIRHIFDKSHFDSIFLDNDIASRIASKWYRDSNNIDISKDVFSIGMVLESHLEEVLANIIRVYIAIESWIEHNEKVVISSNAPRFVSDLAKNFNNNIVFVENNYISDSLCSQFNHPSASLVKVKRFSSIMRYLQSIFIKKIVGKVMRFPDWTYKHQKSKEFLYQNSYNILNGFYLLRQPKYKDILLSDIFSDHRVYGNIREILSEFSNYKDIDSLSKVILDNIIHENNSLKSEVITMYSIYKDLLDRYKPCAIIIPGMSFSYCLIMQIANSMKIPVLVVIDGYPVFFDKYDIIKSKFGKSAIVKNIASMGIVGHKILEKEGFKEENIIQIRPPLLDYHHTNIENRLVKYEAMVLLAYSNSSNILAIDDYRYQNIIDIIKCLKSIGIKKISVKIKPGNNMNNIVILRNILDKFNYSNVSITEGALYKSVHLSSFVIGPLGSSIVEYAYNDIPYYVYEPYNNGISDEIIHKSIISNASCARSIDELKENLVYNRSLILNIEDMISGVKLSEISYNDLLV